MDKIDAILSMLLLQNSRIPYRELAKRLNLSINAVHKRIQALHNNGVIKSYTTKISLRGLNILNLLVFGNSKIGSMDETREKLSKNRNTYWVANAANDQIYIGAYLPNLAELESYIAFVKEASEIKDSTVCISSDIPQGPPPLKLSSLDFQILYLLRKEARKPLADVAKELNVSTKTVHNHLEKLIKNNWVEFSIEWYPHLSNDIITFFHLYLDEDIDRIKFGTELVKNYFPNVMFFWSFSNLPNFLIIAAWTPTMADLKDLRKNIQWKGVKSIITNILYQGFQYDTWRDEYLINNGKF